MAGRVSVMKELFGLLRKADKLFEGQVEIVLDDGENENEDNEEMLRLLLTITPNDGLYKGARCTFEVKIDMNCYPDEPPVVNCLNKIYHPNINTRDEDGGGDICVNLLGQDWQQEVGLDGCVMAVLFLFYNPQIDDCLSPVCCGFDFWGQFADNVPGSLRGQEIDGYEFDRLIDDIDENKDRVLDAANIVDDENREVLEAAGIVNDENKEVLDVAVDDRNKEILEATTNVVDDENKEVLDVAVDDRNKELLEATTNVVDDENKEVLDVAVDDRNKEILEATTNVVDDENKEVLNGAADDDDNKEVLDAATDVVKDENKEVFDVATDVVNDENKEVFDAATDVVNDENKEVFNAATGIVDDENNEVLEATNGVVEDKEGFGTADIPPQDKNEKENDMAENVSTNICLGNWTEDEQQVASSGFEQESQSDFNSDISVTTDMPPEVCIIHNESSSENHGNCSSSRFKTWYIKLKERFAVLQNRMKDRS